MALTSCTTTFNFTNQKIVASSRSPHDEPQLDWDTTTSRYLSSTVRKQLGVLPGDHMSLEDRGVLGLPGSFLEPQPPSDFLSSRLTSETIYLERMLSQVDRYYATIAMCFYGCRARTSKNNYWLVEVPHRTQISLFQDILTTTQSPAQALLAQYFTLHQMAYYDSFPEFGQPANATTGFSVAVTMPVSWNGLTAVLVILAVHVLCVAGSTLILIRTTRLSLLGNSWQAISQVALGDAHNLIAHSSLCTDAELKRSEQAQALGKDTPVYLRMDEKKDNATLIFRRSAANQ